MNIFEIIGLTASLIAIISLLIAIIKWLKKKHDNKTLFTKINFWKKYPRRIVFKKPNLKNEEHNNRIKSD